MREMRASVAVIVIALAGIWMAGCNGGNDDPPTATMTPAVTQSPTSTTTEPPATPTPSIEEEVEEAYLAHWEAYADAVLNLDVTLVDDFASGEELEAIREEIETLRADGVALRVVVEHDLMVVDISERTAVVVDELVNNSFYVDAETKEPAEGEGSGEILRHTAHLEKVDGGWVVVRVTHGSG